MKKILELHLYPKISVEIVDFACIANKKDRPKGGGGRELAQLNREIEEKKKSLAMTSFSSVSQLITQSVAEPGNSCPRVDIKINSADKNDKDIVNQNASTYMVAMEKCSFYCCYWCTID